jgi:hypothetical protein
MPFIPPNPDLSKLPPHLRERAYREQHALLIRQQQDLQGSFWYGVGLLLFVTILTAAASASVMAFRFAETSP